MKGLIDWLDEGKTDNKYTQLCKKLLCKDGTELSIQASSYHYCNPRLDSINNTYGDYSSFEIGFPTKQIDCLLSYAEQPEDPTNTVYGRVPISIIEEAVEACGGIIGFAEKKQ